MDYGFHYSLYAGGVSTLNGWLVSYLEGEGIVRGEGAIFLSYFWLGIMLGGLSFLQFRIKLVISILFALML